MWVVGMFLLVKMFDVQTCGPEFDYHNPHINIQSQAQLCAAIPVLERQRGVTSQYSLICEAQVLVKESVSKIKVSSTRGLFTQHCPHTKGVMFN